MNVGAHRVCTMEHVRTELLHFSAIARQVTMASPARMTLMSVEAALVSTTRLAVMTLTDLLVNVLRGSVELHAQSTSMNV